MIPTPPRPVSASDIADRCARSSELIADLTRRFQTGDAATDLLARLQLLWADASGLDPPPEVRDALDRLQGDIATATRAAAAWMSQTAQRMDTIARGLRMRRAYSHVDEA